jgi:glycosyltransferase involved in cell wall biosynthesis
MIKVVHLITNLETGGAEMMLYKLLAATDPTRIENVVISLTGEGTLGQSIRDLGIRLHLLGIKKDLSAVSSLFQLIRVLQREKPQVLQTWLYHADLAGFVAGKIARIPTILWNVRCSNTGPVYASGQGRALLYSLTKLSRRPEAIVINSRAGIEFHEGLGYRPKRWELMPNGFDLDKFKPDPGAGEWLRAELGVAPDAPLIGLVARFDVLKNQRNFLEAAVVLRKSDPNARYVMVGRGIEADNPLFAEMISELDLWDVVCLMSERQDVSRITAGLDIAVCSSISEGFPNVVGEAMACGIPCAATDVGDTSWIIGETGRIAPPSDPAALANAWRELIDLGVELRMKLGRAARRRVVENFSMPVVARNYQAMYEGFAGVQDEMSSPS